jgi:hypothetical protein
MATRFVQESQLLIADHNEQLNLQSPRLEYLWQIGRFDFSDGMTKADHVSFAAVLPSEKARPFWHTFKTFSGAK